MCTRCFPWNAKLSLRPFRIHSLGSILWQSIQKLSNGFTKISNKNISLVVALEEKQRLAGLLNTFNSWLEVVDQHCYVSIKSSSLWLKPASIHYLTVNNILVSPGGARLQVYPSLVYPSAVQTFHLHRCCPHFNTYEAGTEQTTPDTVRTCWDTVSLVPMALPHLALLRCQEDISHNDTQMAGEQTGTQSLSMM